MSDGLTQPNETMVGGGVALACGLDGELHPQEQHGLFAADTRVLSTYRFLVGGHSWKLLSRSRLGPSRIQWDYQNVALRAPIHDIPAGQLHLRIRRGLSGALHDDLEIVSFASVPVPVRFSILLDADFMDVFEIVTGSMPPRLHVARAVLSSGLSLAYERRGFRRALHVQLVPAFGTVTFVGHQVVFDLTLVPQQPWSCCVDAIPEVDGRRIEFDGDPHGPFERRSDSALTVRAIPVVSQAVARGLVDLERLRMSETPGTSFPAAGAPWFMALFGRDPLLTGLMAGIERTVPLRGALDELARHQARAPDPFRDAEPGKFPHELRRGELAFFHRVPHSPYYGSHDAPALFVLALWSALRWTGDRTLLDRHLPAAIAALEWCARDGDRDGDGLLEYATHSRLGYRNQGWKDSGDAIPHVDGVLAEPPIATIELQGYWFAALRAMAEMLDLVERPVEAQAHRERARALQQRVEDSFWMEDDGFYALALDRDKRVVRSIASNAGHLLWCGLPSVERARRVAARMLDPDLFSGYGVRTLAAHHRRYNPLSYQLGSVWPHDSALIAAGCLRYGLREAAGAIFEGLLVAAFQFEEQRLPELFCGFPRSAGQPVPYERANAPQAWAAAVPLLAVQSFLGLAPNAIERRFHLEPWLPDWLPRLAVEGISIGGSRLDVTLARRGDRTEIEAVSHSDLEMRVGQATGGALWG